MIWHLLWLYPLIGVVITPWLYRGESKRDRLSSTLDKVSMVGCVLILWPALVFIVPSEWKDSDTYWAERKDTEMEALLESVRQERLAPDPRLAEFDILLGIEPVPSSLSWEHYLDNGWDAISEVNYRVRDIARKPRFSRGGYTVMAPNEPMYWYPEPKPPTLTELNQGLTNKNKGFSL